MASIPRLIIPFISLVLFIPVRAADPPTKPAKPGPKPNYAAMDYGPALGLTLTAQPGDNTALKALVIRVGANPETCVAFDTETLRYVAGWTGGHIDYHGVSFDGAHGTNPKPAGTQRFYTKPGVGFGRAGEFKDPRPAFGGSLPRDWGHFNGYSLNGAKVILSYTVGDTQVYDLPGVEVVGDQMAFTRTLQIEPSSLPISILVCEVDGASGYVAAATHSLVGADQTGSARGQVAVLIAPKSQKPSAGAADTHTVAAIANAPQGATWQVVGSRVQLTLPALTEMQTIQLAIWNGPPDKINESPAILRGSAAYADLKSLTTTTGPQRCPDVLTVKGTVAKDDKPYVVDSIPPPADNPWKSWIRWGGFDFFPDGRAALCTWSGDVWIASGIDSKLESVQYRRFATGLFDGLGLKVVEHECDICSRARGENQKSKIPHVYVLGRDGITRLHDLNNDLEADYYEAFNHDVVITKGFHEFAFDLHTDSQGNFHFIKGGPVKPGGHGFEKIGPHNGTMLKVSKDGSTIDVIATGFRAPNGMGVGPNDELTSGDNEGTWTPVCRLNWIERGGFYGVVDLAHRTPPPTDYDKPLCWFPKSVDNSSGSQVWVTSDKFGAFKGDLLHLSYGTSSLFKVMYEKIDGQIQGGVVKFPLSFTSSAMRARFHPIDGHLYIGGLRGWQTNAAQDAGFNRVRYTGKPVNMPKDLHVKKNAIEITFTGPLDAASASDDNNYSIEAWNYLWQNQYGSKEYKPSNSKATGRDPWDVASAKLSADGRTIRLEVPDLKPVMQMKIKYKIKAADGSAVEQEIYNTVNRAG